MESCQNSKNSTYLSLYLSAYQISYYVSTLFENNSKKSHTFSQLIKSFNIIFRVSWGLKWFVELDDLWNFWVRWDIFLDFNHCDIYVTFYSMCQRNSRRFFSRHSVRKLFFHTWIHFSDHHHHDHPGWSSSSHWHFLHVSLLPNLNLTFLKKTFEFTRQK